MEIMSVMRYGGPQSRLDAVAKNLTDAKQTVDLDMAQNTKR